MKKNEFISLVWVKTRIHCLKRIQKKYHNEFFETIIRDCNIDLMNQYSNNPNTNDGDYTKYYLLKLINTHAFQAKFTKSALCDLVANGYINPDSTLVMVDIGDSAGTHLKYQRKMLQGMFEDIRTVSVNLDPVAVEKIRAGGGGEAVLCRAEDYRPDGLSIDVYLSYEMVEHLHNPALFFYRLAKSNNGKYMVVTVPYRKRSRVAVGLSMNCSNYDKITAEDEHIFELCPNDWQRLLWHAGWKVRKDEIYYQYPRRSIFTPLYRCAWEQCDFEGFYAMLLERDMTAANLYTDWED